MILVLNNGERVEVFRQTCGWQYKDYKNEWSREWNIDVLEHVRERDKGFFAVGAIWGKGGNEKCDMLIPSDSVNHIEEVGKWERPEKEFIDSQEMDI